MKPRRGRTGLTKAEFRQQEYDREVAERVDEVLANIAKRKEEVEKEKCYPVPHGDVSTCPKNNQGYCNLFNKACNNIGESK